MAAHRIPPVSVILITKINPDKYLQTKITLIWIQKPDFAPLGLESLI